MGRRTFGDLAAVVEHDDFVGDAHDQAHIMLDEQQRDPRVPQAQQQLAQLDFLGVVQSRGRLIEEQDPRLHREASRNLQQPPLPESKRFDVLVRQMREADARQQALRILHRAFFLDAAWHASGTIALIRLA